MGVQLRITKALPAPGACAPSGLTLALSCLVLAHESRQAPSSVKRARYAKRSSGTRSNDATGNEQNLSSDSNRAFSPEDNGRAVMVGRGIQTQCAGRFVEE